MIRSSELTIRISIEKISGCLRYLYRKHFSQGACGTLSEQRNAPAFELHIGIAHLTKFPRRLVQKRQNSAPRRPATPPPVNQICAQKTPVPHNFHILRSTLRQTCIPVTTCVARTSTLVASHICSWRKAISSCVQFSASLVTNLTLLPFHFSLQRPWCLMHSGASSPPDKIYIYRPQPCPPRGSSNPPLSR